MSQQTVSGAMLLCSFGVAPGTLNVLPVNLVNTGGPPAANIMDHKPTVNIAPFGMCMSMANPMVAAATAAAMGVLTPVPCIPMTVAPWTPGAPTSLLKNFPALTNASTCMCNWAGAITISVPAQFQTTAK